MTQITFSLLDNKTSMFYRNIAINMAKNSSIKKRCGAVLVHRNKVISVGYNYSLKISTKNKYCLLRRQKAHNTR